MTPTVPRFEELAAPSHWRTVDFISDLHLQAAEPATVTAWQNYLQATPADALFILGDLFEVWVGDDAIEEPGSFEAEACAALQATARRLPVFFMHGNRDFLTGVTFLHHCGITGLADPTVLGFGGQRIVLSHGDSCAWRMWTTSVFAYRPAARNGKSASWPSLWRSAAPRHTASAPKAKHASSPARCTPTWTALPPSPGCRQPTPAPWSTATPTAPPCTPWRQDCAAWC